MDIGDKKNSVCVIGKDGKVIKTSGASKSRNKPKKRILLKIKLLNLLLLFKKICRVFEHFLQKTVVNRRYICSYIQYYFIFQNVNKYTLIGTIIAIFSIIVFLVY